MGCGYNPFSLLDWMVDREFEEQMKEIEEEICLQQKNEKTTSGEVKQDD